MKKIVTIFFNLFVFTMFLCAQEGLNPLSSNPELLNYKENRIVKSTFLRSVTLDSMVYLMDTLDLPLLDDFSTNKFKSYDALPTDSDVTGSTYYTIEIGGIPEPEGTFYAIDTTYSYLYNTSPGYELISKTPLSSITIEGYDVSTYPPTQFLTEVWPPYNQRDTLGGAGISNETLTNSYGLIYQDSITYYVVSPRKDGSIWEDNYVYRNTQMPVNPPTIYVATFDGLDEKGSPYSSNENNWGVADYLTSKPIDLSTTSGLIYLSFFWQTQGMSGDVTVNPDDSLVLEFYDPISKTWDYAWSQVYVEQTDFKHQMIEVSNVNYKNKGFKFRFKNYGTLSGALDHWHLDYIYLDDNRNNADSIYDDIAVQYQAPSLIDPYTAMVWKHYKENPSSFMAASVNVPFRNNDDQAKNLANLSYTISNPDITTEYRNFGGGSEGNINATSNSSYDFRILNDGYIIDTSIPADSCPTFNVEFAIGTSTPNDTLRSNDTSSFNQVFSDYYAYDDGSAEGGYYVYTTFGYPEMAVEYSSLIEDTLKAIDIYFIPAKIDAEDEGFTISVWDNKDDEPIFENERYDYPEYGNGVDNFKRYYFEDKVVVNGTYYVGIRQKSDGRINIGFDLNLDNSDKVFYKENYSVPFSNTSFTGSLMIRPVFKLKKEKWTLSIEEKSTLDVSIYPNPTSGIVYLDAEKDITKVSIINLNGQVLEHKDIDSDQEVNISHLPKGVYILQIIAENGKFVTSKKLIKQ